VLRSKWGRALSVVAVALVLWYFGRSLVAQRAAIGSRWDELHPAWGMLALSGAVVLVSYAVLIETWRRTVVSWGASIGWGDAARIWFVSNLGKYVPGKVWQIGAMSVLAEQSGVPAVAAVGSSLVVNLVNLLAGMLVVLVTAARLIEGASVVPMLVAATVLALATPWLLPWLAQLASAVLRRPIAEPKVPPSAIFVALGGCMLAWVLYGVAFRLLAAALFGVTSGTTASYVAVFTLSYLAGYVFLFSPGGLGAREEVLQRLIAATALHPLPDALLLIVVSRLWLTVLEAAPGLLLLLLRRPISVRPPTS
jgi:hypothetical protein